MLNSTRALLVLSYDLLEDRHIYDVITGNLFSLSCKTNMEAICEIYVFVHAYFIISAVIPQLG